MTVGLDVLDPDRLRERLARRPGLRETLFTAREIAYCDAQWDPALHLAGRFCAKEAVVKALMLDGFDPLEIEIVDGNPAPSVVLRGEAAARAQSLDVNVSVSITHVEALAAAVALALPRAGVARLQPAVLPGRALVSRLWARCGPARSIAKSLRRRHRA